VIAQVEGLGLATPIARGLKGRDKCVLRVYQASTVKMKATGWSILYGGLSARNGSHLKEPRPSTWAILSSTFGAMILGLVVSVAWAPFTTGEIQKLGHPSETWTPTIFSV
jgi:hypothetical protein